MAEYIERDKAIQILSRIFEATPTPLDIVGKCMGAIAFLPAADVESVVRCADCAHRGSGDCPTRTTGDPYLDYDMEADAFCSMGEKKDAEPVKHGRWVEHICFDDGFWVCTNCKFVSQATAAPKLYNYCPNCGARMNKEADDNGEV